MLPSRIGKVCSTVRLPHLLLSIRASNVGEIIICRQGERSGDDRRFELAECRATEDHQSLAEASRRLDSGEGPASRG